MVALSARLFSLFAEDAQKTALCGGGFTHDPVLLTPAPCMRALAAAYRYLAAAE